MRVIIVMGNQDLSLIWKILKMLKILMSTLYLILPPLMLVKNLIIMKAMNMLHKEGKSQITIHPLQFILKFQTIKSKI